jgi:hypothetical protein
MRQLAKAYDPRVITPMEKDTYKANITAAISNQVIANLTDELAAAYAERDTLKDKFDAEIAEHKKTRTELTTIKAREAHAEPPAETPA